jgi:hypothetical protein
MVRSPSYRKSGLRGRRNAHATIRARSGSVGIARAAARPQTGHPTNTEPGTRSPLDRAGSDRLRRPGAADRNLRTTLRRLG